MKRRTSGPEQSIETDAGSFRALNAVHAAHRALLRATGTGAALTGACRSLTDEGGYRFAWINLGAAPPLTPAHWDGPGADYLKALQTDGVSLPDSPAGRTLDSGLPSGCVDVHSATGPWAEVAHRHGFQSAVALPLRAGTQVLGVLEVCHDRPAFGSGETALLEDLARDIAFMLADARSPAIRNGIGGSRKLPVHQGNRILLLNSYDICYLQAEGHYTRVVTRDADHLASQVLSGLAERLPRETFLRTHRSFIVNTDTVTALERTDTQYQLRIDNHCESLVPVSRRNLADVRQALGI